MTRLGYLTNDLKNLKKHRFAIMQMESELQTLEAEFTAIKATNYDKLPSGSGENMQEERLLTAIENKYVKELELKATRMHVADMERLLAQLPDDERRVIDVMLVNGEKYARERLSMELSVEQSQIYRIKNKALMHLAELRYGVEYKP